MLIEYDENNFKIIEEKEIDKVNYRIVEFDTGYFGLQYHNDASLLADFIEGGNEWRTIVIHPENGNIPLKEGLGFLRSNGDWILKELLCDKENTYKLKNKDYYEVKIYLDEDDKPDFREIVERRDYEDLIKKLDAYYFELHNKRIGYMNEENKRNKRNNYFICACACFCVIMFVIYLVNSMKVLL